MYKFSCKGCKSKFDTVEERNEHSDHCVLNITKEHIKDTEHHKHHRALVENAKRRIRHIRVNINPREI